MSSDIIVTMGTCEVPLAVLCSIVVLIFQFLYVSAVNGKLCNKQFRCSIMPQGQKCSPGSCMFGGGSIAYHSSNTLS